jgi:hypothetical protein
LIATEYQARFRASAELMRRAAEVMPGENTRATAHYAPFPWRSSGRTAHSCGIWTETG